MSDIAIKMEVKVCKTDLLLIEESEDYKTLVAQYGEETANNLFVLNIDVPVDDT